MALSSVCRSSLQRGLHRLALDDGLLVGMRCSGGDALDLGARGGQVLRLLHCGYANKNHWRVPLLIGEQFTRDCHPVF